jgi:MIP family channel proteins
MQKPGKRRGGKERGRRREMRNAWTTVLVEGVGTFLFFFVGIGAAAVGDMALALGQPSGGLLTIALAHGIVLAVLVSALGPLSGGHFNPAVSFGVWLAGEMPGRRALAYVLAQCIGGLAAAIAVRNVIPAGMSPKLGLPELAGGVSPLAGIAVEAILTIILVVAVFGTAIDPRGPKIGGLAIGFAIAADILMGGPLTGAAMNPARWLGPAAETRIWDNWYVWIIGPALGAAIVGLAYRYLVPSEHRPAAGGAEPIFAG